MLLEMINDILDLAKMESGKMEVRLSEFQIGSLVGAQCDMARPLAEKKNIDLDYEVSAELAAGAAGPGQGAADSQQSAVQRDQVHARGGPDRDRRRARRLRRLAADGHRHRHRHRPDDQQLIFEKFRQAPGVSTDGDAMTREYSGTGLGLSIVRELCRLLGGDVSLESELGKGSTFTVRLPWRLEEVPRLDAQLNEDLEVLTRPRPVESDAGVARRSGRL